MPDSNLLIDATDLARRFGPTQAVAGVSIHVRAGEIYGLVGSDGAGKTTTIRLLCGALQPDAGTVTICGWDVQKQTEEARSQLGYLSQRFSLYEDLTVLENIRFFAEVRGMRSGEWLPRCMAILEFVGLASFKDRRAGQLSGGMKQKLGLASALVTRPRVLLLDEPTTGVDPVTRQDFWQLLISLVSTPLLPEAAQPASPGGRAAEAAGSVAVLLSTPYMDEAARCGRVGFMRRGRIIAEGTPSELRGMLKDRILELSGAPIKLLRRLAQADQAVEDVRAFGDRLHLRIREGAAPGVMERLPSEIRGGGGRSDRLRSIPPQLEDVFIYLSEQSYE
ncbi:MAG TPA: ABC transporter ATP-binding protein [Anaerolineales bacterium]|nr:ABC transporter ATP-binding protein [Anaerolineales bacterium]